MFLPVNIYFYMLKLDKASENHCELLLAQNESDVFVGALFPVGFWWFLFFINERYLTLLIFIFHFCFELLSALPLWQQK